MTIPQIKAHIKDYPDFPKEGIVFRDISPLLANPKALSAAIDQMTNIANSLTFDKIVAIDARGFIFGSILADRLKKSLVLCRKTSKLPGRTVTESYGYEYSNDSLSIQEDAINPGDSVLIVDDVLASGNTALAAYKLVKQLGGNPIGLLCLIELAYLPGPELITKNTRDFPVQAIIRLES